MKQYLFGLTTLLFILFSIVLLSNKSEKIVNIENIEVEATKRRTTKIIYCQSGNYYHVQKERYIKFSKEGNIIERGNFKDVYFHTYSDSTKAIIFSLAVLLTISYILSLYYKKYLSPFQKIKDYKSARDKKTFLNLSEKDKEVIIHKNPCIECKTSSQLIFLKETYDKKWGITQVNFHCKHCENIVKIRR